MDKIPFDQIVMEHISDPSHPALQREIPLLAYQQAAAHEVDFPETVFEKAGQNFSDIVHRNGIDIWMIAAPVYGAGAIFTSPLMIGGIPGVQGEDAVVLNSERGKGFGKALVSFRARLAMENGMEYVGWECEDGNTDSIHRRHGLFINVGGAKRNHVKPFRLDKTIIDALEKTPAVTLTDVETHKSYGNMPVRRYAWKDGSASVSQRFSIFRTLARGGVTGSYDQASTGIQIENLEFNELKTAYAAVKEIIVAETMMRNGCVFADIAARVDTPKQLELIHLFDANQNTYSGDPSCLWILQGAGFEKAAHAAKKIHVR